MQMSDIAAEQGVLAAYMCLIRAALKGFRLSDNEFYNFGVTIAESASEHPVVILDAGSHGWHPEKAFAKSFVNEKIMRKFWAHAIAHRAYIEDIRTNWQQPGAGMQSCLEWAECKWKANQNSPHGRAWNHHTSVIQATEQRDLQAFEQTAPLQFLSWLAGAAGAEEGFSNMCYREMKSNAHGIGLEGEDITIVEELWGRIKGSSHDTKEILSFWYFLVDIRAGVLVSGATELTPDEVAHAELTPDEVARCISKIQGIFKEKEAMEGQVIRKNVMRSMINKRAGWWYAAMAVLQTGLPECGRTSDTDGATEHVCTIAEFIAEMMSWLADFAAQILRMRDTDVYREQHRRSGSDKNTSGLTDEDRRVKAVTRDTRWKFMYGKKLAREAHRATWGSQQCRSRYWMDWWEQRILDDYTSGVLSEKLQAIVHATTTTRAAHNMMFRL
jgi:hypothetical protein